MPSYFSYPFGELSNQLIDEVKSMKQVISSKKFYFKAAFSRTAGPVGCSSNIFALPRFIMNQVYGTVDDSFKIKVNSRHLPVYSVYPDNAAICANSKADKLYFSASDKLDLSDIRCYSEKYKPRVQIAKGLVSVHLNRPFGTIDYNDGKQSLSGRMNCIARTKEEGVFFWYGYSWRIFRNSKVCFSQ